MRPAAWVLATVGITGGVMVSDAQVFVGLGDLPGGTTRSYAFAVSADGTTVVGKSSSASTGRNEDEAFRWTHATGLVGLGVGQGFQPFSFAVGVSSDGAIAVGTTMTPNGPRACKWTVDAGDVLLGDLPGDLQHSVARAVSGNGAVIVGDAQIGTHIVGFMWSEAAGMQPFDGLPTAVTPDGHMIVGNGPVGAGYWTQATGWVSIGLSPFGTTPFPSAVNTDGSVIVGSFDLGGVSRAFRWTPQTGIVSLDHLDVGEQAVATAVSGDGSIVVGSSGVRAFIWDAQHGMRGLKDVLVRDYHLDLSGWGLDTATGISADGTVIVGTGAGPHGQEAWMAIIPEPGALGGLIGGLGILSASGVRARVRR